MFYGREAEFAQLQLCDKKKTVNRRISSKNDVKVVFFSFDS